MILRYLPICAVLMTLPLAVACSGGESKGGAEHGETAAADYERGPHRGRMLRNGGFAVEITIFETNVEPQFRVYAYNKDKPLAPSDVQLTMALTRLGDRVDQFTFSPQEDYLLGSGVVTEPHSFDVAVRAVSGSATHNWSYQSYEGRTTISAEQAEAAGVKVGPAGPATLEETVALSGRVELQPEGRADIKAWYPGRVVAMTKAIGERVRTGEVLARVNSSDSLQTYAIASPINGVVMARNANVGDVAGEAPIYLIADATKVHAEFYVYPRDAERLRVGQSVTVHADHRRPCRSAERRRRLASGAGRRGRRRGCVAPGVARRAHGSVAAVPGLYGRLRQGERHLRSAHARTRTTDTRMDRSARRASAR
ncbi:MAG: cobalt-zinc-cadmium resistance protein CzcB [Alphaproteobacteria bacterium]|nr:MAG: cobalt-zinc-cadmium resistance protein CzcB [Alphaproteobacteria bacterium]